MVGVEEIKSARQISQGIPRPVEAVIAFAGLVICAPVIVLAGLAVRLTSRGPALFKQERVGVGGSRFTLFKMRTMYLLNDGPQVTAGNDSRITPVGRVLRKTKIDELPELWNILKGDMSLVGPRPEVPRYVNFQTHPSWRQVLQVRPGITDPVTLRLRNEEELLSEVEGDREQFYREVLQQFKLRGYLEYQRKRSWRTDLDVLWRTVVAILMPSNAPPPTLEEIARTEAAK